jgi:hypothetical protein
MLCLVVRDESDFGGHNLDGRNFLANDNLLTAEPDDLITHCPHHTRRTEQEREAGMCDYWGNIPRGAIFRTADGESS